MIAQVMGGKVRAVSVARMVPGSFACAQDDGKDKQRQNNQQQQRQRQRQPAAATATSSSNGDRKNTSRAPSGMTNK
jgi:hypothetical protein